MEELNQIADAIQRSQKNLATAEALMLAEKNLLESLSKNLEELGIKNIDELNTTEQNLSLEIEELKKELIQHADHLDQLVKQFNES